MATPLARQASPDSDLPLYRMDVDTYHRLVDAGALDGVEVAVSSHAEACGAKAAMYAAAPVPA